MEVSTNTRQTMRALVKKVVAGAVRNISPVWSRSFTCNFHSPEAMLQYK
ncbi:hypothetical protein [Chitinophaga costaii]|nr:hypothetical protein [Chitinophaga costaii]